MILRGIQPTVIFEEFRPSEFEFYYRRGNLEARTIKMYRELKSFQEVAVDRFEIPGNLHAEMQRFFNCVERESQDYRELNAVNNENIFVHGFPYLNSVTHENLAAKLCKIESDTIIGSGDQDLIRILEKWNHLNRMRESEWLAMSMITRGPMFLMLELF
jgi:hypothetical protein